MTRSRAITHPPQGRRLRATQTPEFPAMLTRPPRPPWGPPTRLHARRLPLFKNGFRTRGSARAIGDEEIKAAGLLGIWRGPGAHGALVLEEAPRNDIEG